MMVSSPLPTLAHPSFCSGLLAVGDSSRPLPLDLLGPQHLAMEGSVPSVQLFQRLTSYQELRGGSEDMEISETLTLRGQGRGRQVSGGLHSQYQGQEHGSWCQAAWLQICLFVFFKIDFLLDYS